MKEYLVTRVAIPDWEKIPRISLTHTGWLPQCPVSAFAQLCHDGHNLYVRMEATEKDIRASLTDPLADICEDSCLEFFFAPREGDPRYFNFEFNPLGNFYMGFGMERNTRARLLPSDTEQFQIHTYYTPKGWGIYYAIPAEFIRMYIENFSFTGKAACNFYKCGELTSVPHYLSWSQMSCDVPDFHRRNDFSTLVFESSF